MTERLETPLDHTPLWTLDELCEKLHTTRVAVHSWRKRGTAPRAYLIGRHLMFDETDVRAWLEERARAADQRPDDSVDTGW